MMKKNIYGRESGFFEVRNTMRPKAIVVKPMRTRKKYMRLVPCLPR